MNLFTLARVIETKYGFVSEGAEPPVKKDPVADYLAKNPPTPKAQQVPAQIVAQIKKDIVNAYDLYVNSATAKEPVLQMLSNAGEEFSKKVVKKFETLVSNINRNAGTVENLYSSIKELRDDFKGAKNNKKIREAIHNSVRATKESEVNYREHVKSKFEMIVSRVLPTLEKQAQRLSKFIPDEPAQTVSEHEQPHRKELSKEKLAIFMKTPAAQAYGLDNMNVMEKILFFSELRHKVTTLVNAIDRGHIPADGPEVAKETAEIVEAFKLKETNVGALEQSRLPNPQLERALIQQKNDEIFQKNKERELALKYDPSFVAQQHEKTVRDEELAERNQDFDRQEKEKTDLINKYNSLSFSDWLKRSSK